MKLRTLFAALAILMAGTMFAQAQSLADVAKQKSDKKAAKVITDDDIPTRTDKGASSNGAAVLPAEAAAPAPKADDSKQADAQDKDKDKKKDDDESPEVKAAKGVVKAKSIQIDAVTDELHKLEDKLSQASTDQQREDLQQQISNLQHNIEVWKGVRADAQQTVDSASKPKQ